MVCLAAGVSRAQQKRKAPLVVVYPVECSRTKVDAELCNAVGDTVLTTISSSKVYRVVDRAHRDKVLKEQLECRKDIYSKECWLEVGRLLVAKKMVTGRLTSLGAKDFQLSLTITNLTGGNVEQGLSRICKGCDKVKLLENTRKWAMALVRGHHPPPPHKRGRVYFSVSPGGATLWIAGKSHGQLPAPPRTRSVELFPGKHSVRIVKPGYQDEVLSVKVVTGKVVTVKRAMLPAESPKPPGGGTGVVDVRAVDAASGKKLRGAEVFVDGVRAGSLTPISLGRVSAGRRIVEVRMPLYHRWRARVTVRSDDISTVVARLKPNFGSVHLVSDPPGADVFMEGRKRGTTPLVLKKIESKAYKLLLRKSLHHEESFVLWVREGKSNRKRIKLRPAFGTLALTSAPSGAAVEIDGRRRGVTPLTIPRLPSGSYLVSLQLRNHFRARQRVRISDGATTSRHVVLQSDRGRLRVTSTPAGATVSLDGQKVGRTPLSLAAVAAGPHRVRVHLDRPPHRPHQENVTVAVGQETAVNARLVPRVGSVLVITTPPGARVSLDGTPRGRAPVKLTGVFVGRHIVQVQAAGMTPQRRDVTVLEGEAAYARITLSSKPSLRVACSEAGSTLTVNGEEQAGPRAHLRGLASGSYKVKCAKDGFRDLERDIALSAGDNKKITLTMSSKPELIVDCKPHGARVFVNGRDAGSSPVTVNDLRAGEHRIRCEHSGYKDFEDEVDLEDGETTRLDEELSRPNWFDGLIAAIRGDDSRGLRILVGGDLLDHETINLSFPDAGLTVYRSFNLGIRGSLVWWSDYVGAGVDASVVATLWYWTANDAAVTEFEQESPSWVLPRIHLSLRPAPKGFLSRFAVYGFYQYGQMDETTRFDYTDDTQFSFELHRVGAGLSIWISRWLILRSEYCRYLGTYTRDISNPELSHSINRDIAVHALGGSATSHMGGKRFGVRLRFWIHAGLEQVPEGNHNGGFYAFGISAGLFYWKY